MGILERKGDEFEPDVIITFLLTMEKVNVSVVLVENFGVTRFLFASIIGDENRELQVLAY